MPLTALVFGRILCMHGGLSKHLQSIDDLREIKRPTKLVDGTIQHDLVWSDPDSNNKGWKPNSLRNASYTFGSDVVHEYVGRLNIDLIVRAHQVVQDGYEFFAGRKLITIFSAPNYCGQFNNAAAVLNVKEDLSCSIHVLRPVVRGVKLLGSDGMRESELISDSVAE
ncbi:hypothetical protein QR680_018888 [Steinernema hermaphroditum]|uniref:Serine/threonine specific protein phosphatases domain-containing protein n=1 Tax=Steinernema hermaphroditum TaxID=289476 RepID=A0AA39HLM2_9BILA|nr:hypothetical protein QR680_018888 [Steinernema hermaphroditum]